MTIWFDVEDLIRFFQISVRPTGIQRFSFETYRAVWRLAGASGDIRFCRRGAGGTGYRSIHFPALEAGILAASTAPPSRIEELQRQPFSRIGNLARRLPPSYRLPLGVMARAGLQAAGAVRDLAAAAAAQLSPGPALANRVGGHQFDLEGPDVVFASGDWFVNLGASWDTAYEPDFLQQLHACDTRFALLIYDLIPELFPEWYMPSVTGDFSKWLRLIVPEADMIFTISRATAADLTACLLQQGKNITQPAVLPVGGQPQGSLPASPPLVEQPYVLMVGTIEARKNHAAMLRVWRRLLQNMPAEAVPSLVFAGKIGWLTADFMQQLNNAEWLGGKIRFAASPTEAELASLYRHCQFTVFPSLYEGWGLPVTESLSFGKMAAASNRSAITEAGGDFCAYFDPENISEVYEIIRGLIENPAQIAAMEARIAAGFRVPSWENTAASLLARLGLESQLSFAQMPELQATIQSAARHG